MSQIREDIVTVYKADPDNLENNIIKRMPISDLEKINNKAKINFLEANSLEDLYKLIKFQGGIEGSAQSYSPEILIEIINKVKDRELDLSYVTRANNLRLAVKNIFDNSYRADK